MSGILDGVRVVELASWAFVPAAGAALASWGAEVIKVEDTRGGDPARTLVVGGLTRDKANAEADFMWEINNRGKRSIAIDLKSEGGREIFGKLIASADVFLTNWLPGPRQRAKLDTEDIRAWNPNIIIARGSGQGTKGPDADQGGFDAASYMARGGVSYGITPPGTEIPISQGAAFGDLPSGFSLAGGILGALYHREKTGEAVTVDVSLLAQAVWTMAPDISAGGLFGVDRVPMAPPGTALNPVVNKFKTSDGRWIQLVFLQPDKFWAGFCVRIGLPELATDERFVPAMNLIKNSDEATKLIADQFAKYDLAYWRKALEDEPGVWAVVQSPREVLDDPQVIANGYVITNQDPHGKPYRIPAPPVQFNETSPAPSRAPEYGADTDGILAEIGFSEDEIINAKISNAAL